MRIEEGLSGDRFLVFRDNLDAEAFVESFGANPQLVRFYCFGGYENAIQIPVNLELTGEKL